MERAPIPLKECVEQWRAYRAGLEGKPAPDWKEPPAPEGYAGFGYAVAQEMQDDPVFFRLVVGKLGAKLIGPG
jgi:hypothetical protein